MGPGEQGSSRVGVAALIALVVLLVGGLLAVRVLRERPERSSQSVSLEDRSYEVGQCLHWDQGDGPTTDRAETVPCDQEHLREVVGVVSLDDVEGGFPTEAEWTRLKDRCDPLVERYLGRYVNSVLAPIGQATIKSREGAWFDGDRDLVCLLGLRQVDLAAKRARIRVPFRGRVRDLDLVSPYEAGDCVRWTEEEVGTVPCTEAHHYEVTGIIDVRAATAKATQVRDVDRLGVTACPSRLEGHLDGSVPTGVSSTFIPMDQEELDGGVRGLVCLGARFLGRETVELTAPL